MVTTNGQTGRRSTKSGSANVGSNLASTQNAVNVLPRWMLHNMTVLGQPQAVPVMHQLSST